MCETVSEDEHIILKKSYLKEIFSKVSCGQCYGQLKTNFTNKFLDHKLDRECEDCGTKVMDPEVKDTPVTKAMVYSTMNLGIGYAGFHNFTGHMRINPLYDKYNHFQSVALDATKEKVKEILNISTEAAKSHYSAKDGIYDMKVIFDGSWQKRGHTSNLCVGAVIDVEVGLVLDYETMCKFCEACTKKENAKKQGKVSNEEFDRWMAGHKDKCMKNYEGSSGGMEAAIAVKLFSRSLDKNMRYTVFISDGDSSAYNAVCDMNNGDGPYGDVKVEKGECISHVAKRLGIALRKVREQVLTERKNKVRKSVKNKGYGR